MHFSPIGTTPGELTGFEIKNRDFTGFSAGGAKTAWQSAALPTDRALVVTESAIDALSHFQLRPGARTESRYVSTAGAPSPRQWELLDRLFAALPAGAELVAAVDADAPGHALAERLQTLARKHSHLAFRRDTPTPDKDWNDVLQRLERARPMRRWFGPERT